jgi:MarR family transcriptional regulator, organic hydroperoxide resistance regulator
MAAKNHDPLNEQRIPINQTATGVALHEKVGRVSDIIKSACQLSSDGLADPSDRFDALARPPGD